MYWYYMFSTGKNINLLIFHLYLPIWFNICIVLHVIYALIIEVFRTTTTTNAKLVFNIFNY